MFSLGLLTVFSCPSSADSQSDWSKQWAHFCNFLLFQFSSGRQKIIWHVTCSLCPNIVMYESSSVISGLKVAILEPVLLLSRSELILRSDTYTPSVHCSSSCTVGIQTWLILYHCSLRAGDKVVSQHCTVSHLWVVRLNVIINKAKIKD